MCQDLQNFRNFTTIKMSVKNRRVYVDLLLYSLHTVTRNRSRERRANKRI